MRNRKLTQQTLLLALFARDFPFWMKLSAFFIRTAFVTIGGSYTVIPYVAQVAVMKFSWDRGWHIPTAADSFTAHYLYVIAFGCWHTGRVARLNVERQRKGEDKGRREVRSSDG